MRNFINTFIVSAIIFISAISGAANSPLNGQGPFLQANPIKAGEMSLFNFKNIESNAFLNNNAVASEAGATYDDAAMLSGVWRFNYTTNVCAAWGEVVFQPNGGYSSITRCNNGAYGMYMAGRWYVLKSGAVRVQYTDYSPKEFQGVKVRIPDGETLYYQFVDRNRLKIFGTVAYRAQ